MVVLLVSVCARTACESKDPVDDLLPRPQRVLAAEGEFSFDRTQAQFTLSAPAGEALDRLSERLNEAFVGLDLAKPMEAAPSDGFRLSVAAPGPMEGVELPAEAREEGYVLDVTPSGVVVSAESERGLFYGVMTLRQLLTRARVRKTMLLPCLRIVDWPALPMRGYHEDYGRDQLPTLEDHRRSIRTVAQYKMNTYLWFIEPDHFVYTFDPDLSTEYDRFRFDEIRDLVAYAERHYVEVIPVVELLGHMEMTLRHERYKNLAEMPEGGGDLCATSDASFDLVRKMVDEIAPAFGGPYFHCGLDESYAIGQGKSIRAVEEKGIERVFAEYYTRMNDVVKSHGQTMIMYADIVLNHPGILALLPKDIVMMFWDYAPRDHYDGLDTLKTSGYPVMALSGLWDWNNLYPCYGTSFKNIATLAAQAAEVGALGHFVSSWGDGYRGAAGVNLSELNDFGFVYCGAVSWNPAPFGLESYGKAFALQYFGMDEEAVSEALVRLARCQEGHNQAARRLLHADAVETVWSLVGADEGDVAFWKGLKEDASAVHAVLGKANPVRNADYLRSIDLAARLLECAADMALACREAARTAEDPQADRLVVLDQLERVRVSHEALWDQYEAAYRATNRPLNLDHIGRSWRATSESLAALIADLRSGAFPPSYEKALRATFAFDGEGDSVWRDSCGTDIVLRPVEGLPQPEICAGGPSGAGSYLHLPHGARCEALDAARAIDFKAAPFLVEAWVRHEGQREQQYGASIFSFGVGGSGFRLGLNHKGEVLFTLYGIEDRAGANSVVPPDGRWHHVAVNFHECHRVDYYVDGRLTDQLEINGCPRSPGDPLIRVGNEIGLVTPFEGDIDRIRVSSGVYLADELDSAP